MSILNQLHTPSYLLQKLRESSAPAPELSSFLTRRTISSSLPWCLVIAKPVTVFVPIPAHAPITAHQCHFQFKICGTINRPLKSSHPVASDDVPSQVLNTENHQLMLYVNFHLLTFRPISCFYQLFKLTNFKPCHNHMCHVATLPCHLVYHHFQVYDNVSRLFSIDFFSQND